jgi:hypothetical protein
MERWNPGVKCSEREARLPRLVGKSRKLFVFPRELRHEIFDEEFQSELEVMYRDTGQGEEPQPPALMCMAVLPRGYLQVSDAEAVRLSATDRCWRMVLGTLEQDDDAPAFSQGGLQQFRERLIRHDMDRRILERTVELARRSNAFDWKKLPKSVRVAVDSRPLEGAGRVEDTINLLGGRGAAHRHPRERHLPSGPEGGALSTAVASRDGLKGWSGRRSSRSAHKPA